MLKKIHFAVLAVMLMIGLFTTPAFCSAGGIDRDKQMHIGASAAVEVFMAHNKPFNSWAPWQRSLFNVVVIGGAKELYDSRHPDRHSADWGDIGADAIGAFGAEGMIWLVHTTW